MSFKIMLVSLHDVLAVVICISNFGCCEKIVNI